MATAHSQDTGVLCCGLCPLPWSHAWAPITVPGPLNQRSLAGPRRGPKVLAQGSLGTGALCPYLGSLLSQVQLGEAVVGGRRGRQGEALEDALLGLGGHELLQHAE